MRAGVNVKRRSRAIRTLSFKAFGSEQEALRAYEDGAYAFARRHSVPEEMQSTTSTPIPEAIVVDAACAGNPGVMEYRGLYLPSRTTLFEMGPFPLGTNNIGEFLATSMP